MIQPVTPRWKQMPRGRMIILSSYNKCGNERVGGTEWLNWQGNGAWQGNGGSLNTSIIIYTVRLKVLYLQNEIYNIYSMDLPTASVVKNLPAKQETGVWFLDWEDPLEKEMATHFSILAWRSPWTEEPGGYSPWVHKEADTTYWLNNSNNIYSKGLM